jgi:TatD DNase family protein
MFSPKAAQERWFARQMDIAQQLNLPLILHERDSAGRFLEMLKSHWFNGCSAVVHCFTGTREELFSYLDLGCYIGITGILTIKGRGAPLRDMVPQIPDNRILIETDAPYLTPAPEKNRTRRNEPAFVRSVLLTLSRLKGKDPKTYSEVIWENTCALYNIASDSDQILSSPKD